MDWLRGLCKVCPEPDNPFGLTCCGSVFVLSSVKLPHRFLSAALKASALVPWRKWPLHPYNPYSWKYLGTARVTCKYRTDLFITVVFWHLLPCHRLIKHIHTHFSIKMTAQNDRITLTLVITKACVGWMFYYLNFCHPLLRLVVAAAHGLNDIPQG